MYLLSREYSMTQDYNKSISILGKALNLTQKNNLKDAVYSLNKEIAYFYFYQASNTPKAVEYALD